MVQFLSIIFFLGFLQFLLGFLKVPFSCGILYIVLVCIAALLQMWANGKSFVPNAHLLMFEQQSDMEVNIELVDQEF